MAYLLTAVSVAVGLWRTRSTGDVDWPEVGASGAVIVLTCWGTWHYLAEWWALRRQTPWEPERDIAALVDFGSRYYPRLQSSSALLLFAASMLLVAVTAQGDVLFVSLSMSYFTIISAGVYTWRAVRDAGQMRLMHAKDIIAPALALLLVLLIALGALTATPEQYRRIAALIAAALVLIAPRVIAATLTASD